MILEKRSTKLSLIMETISERIKDYLSSMTNDSKTMAEKIF